MSCLHQYTEITLRRLDSNERLLEILGILATTVHLRTKTVCYAMSLSLLQTVR